MLTDKQIVEQIESARGNRTETTNIEFKDARGGMPGDTWKTISSFSHKPNGGIIVFGIKEDRTAHTVEVVGGLDIALLQEKLTSLINDGMRNVGNFDFRIIPYNGTTLLALVISETPDESKPAYLYHLSLPRGACVREGNTDRTISEDEMRNFIRNSSVFKFDQTKAPDTSVDELSI